MSLVGRSLSACLAALLAGCVSGSVAGSAAPPPPDVTPRPQATPIATASPSTAATPTLAPTPEPTLDPSALELEVTSCDGGVVLHWSASTDPAFHHYTALRSPEREIAPHYPPIAPAVDWGDAYATDRFVTSAADASIIPSGTTWFYRVMAYDANGAVIGASPVRPGRLHEVDALGQIEAEPAGDDRTILRWQPYGGFSRCFSHYRVQYSTFGTPSTVLAIVSAQSTSELRTDALHPEMTYRLRVQAVRNTTLGSFVVGETEVSTYTVP